MSYACDYDRTGTRDIRYGSPASAEALQKLADHGVNWISIMPFGFQRSEPEVRIGGYEDDESLRGATKQAHACGIKVMLKPHVWARDEEAMQRWSDQQWQTWFQSYEKFIVHYATLARDAQIDALCIGNEQKHSTKYEREWRRIIERVRSIYKGPLTYGANFDEVERVAFWDAVDWIGVSAYFPLIDARSPSRAALIEAWQPVMQRLAALSKKYRKPILFTEIGYRSADGAVWRQWELPRTAPLNLEVQREAYEAFFAAVWPQPWLLGAYPWKWFSSVNHSDHRNNDYEIENKPAADVIKRHYKARSGSRSAAGRDTRGTSPP
jgi:arabinogalactan endo-1,4-beta-galactosidase